ncbi:cysteine synthase A [Buchnera aphidicola (Mindarus keteleerifoliae)]|uniref:cysteine synthase A n=1 Tax=Buchnera aphidicola TaxID=9 RepID=UPI0031B7063C
MYETYENNSLTIGKTPIVKLNHIGNGNIFAKIESRNPGFSVKCRVSENIIKNAEKRGKLKKNHHLIEATSGNIGISLACVAASKNYKITLTMPETMSKERINLLKMLGANLILTNGKQGMKGAIKKLKEIISLNPKKYFHTKQFENPDNPKIHEKTTGPEIWKDMKGKIDIFVSGVGTGGTITGVNRFFNKKTNKKILSIAVEPKNSPIITNVKYNKNYPITSHKIQGIGAGFIPKNLDLNLIDKIVLISDEEAIKFARKLMKKEGILAGISSGAAVAAAVKINQNPLFKEKKIVVILPSSGERYLSTALFA